VPEITISAEVLRSILCPRADAIDLMRSPQIKKENKWIPSAANIYPGRISLTTPIVVLSRVRIRTNAIEIILIKIELVTHFV
jgi:hypothetical protein